MYPCLPRKAAAKPRKGFSTLVNVIKGYSLQLLINLSVYAPGKSALAFVQDLINLCACNYILDIK